MSVERANKRLRAAVGRGLASEGAEGGNFRMCKLGLIWLTIAHVIEASADYLIGRAHPDLGIYYYTLAAANLAMALLFIAKAELSRRRSSLIRRSGGLLAWLRGEVPTLLLFWPSMLLVGCMALVLKVGAALALLGETGDWRYAGVWLAEGMLLSLLVSRTWRIWAAPPQAPAPTVAATPTDGATVGRVDGGEGRRARPRRRAVSHPPQEHGPG